MFFFYNSNRRNKLRRSSANVSRKKANIQLPTLQDNGDSQREELKAKVYKVNEFTAEFYHQNLYKPQKLKIRQEYVKKETVK